jgi:uncharacterized protein YkwD
MFTYILTILLCQFGPTSSSTEICLSANEIKLYELINEIRAKEGMESIPLSGSLSLVAKSHAIDLSENEPFDNKNCNMHSWSDKGTWTACCYRSDHSNAECMWKKPSELTDYDSDGFEIVAYWQTSENPEEEIKPETAIEMWLDSPGHSNVILNKMSFAKAKWKAVGVAIHGNFATVWFGMEEDVAPNPTPCSD